MFIPASEKRRSKSGCTRIPRFVTVVTVGVTAVGILTGMAPSAAAEPAAAPLIVDVVGDSSTPDGAGLDPALQALSRVAEQNPDLALDVSVAAAPGARTIDYFGAQPSTDGQTIVNSAQHDQIRRGAQVVLVRFGGNDAELAHVLSLVKRANRTEPGDLDVTMRSIEGLLDVSAPDEDYVTQALETAPTVVSRMLQVLAGITERAPDARIVVTNYPVAVDAQDAQSLEQADSRDLTTAEKANYDLNQSIARAVQICQCADLADVSDAVAGHEAYTADSAFSRENPAQLNDKGAALMASPLAADLAGVLGVRAPEPNATMIAQPSNVETRVGVSDMDGDTVPDAQDPTPTVPNSDAPAPEPAPKDPGPVDQGLPPNTKPGRDDTETDNDPDSDDATDTGDRDAVPAGLLADGNDMGITVQDVSGTEMTSADLSATQFASTFAAPASAKTATSAKASRSAQPPPVPTRNPDKGDDLGEVHLPAFSLPAVFGDEENRAIALTQLGFTDWSQRTLAPNDNNSVSVDTVGGAKSSRIGAKTFQTTKATRNVQDGTLELDVSTRTGVDYDLGIGKYTRGVVDKTGYKLGPESTKQYDQNGKLPSWGTMRPGDSITRTPPTPNAVASEWGVGRDVGKYAKAQVVSYNEGPMMQYTVTALGDKNYTVTFGDTTSNTKRNNFSLLGVAGMTLAGTKGESTKAEVMYSAQTPAKMAEMTQALASLEKGATPTFTPGTYYSAITEARGDQTGTLSGSKGGKKGATAPKNGVDPTSFVTAEAEVGVTGSRDVVTTTISTLMKSVDGTLNNSEPVGQYTITTTRLNTGTPFGPSSYRPNSTPLSTVVKSFYDGPVHYNTLTFTMNGQKYTLSEGDMVQRARDMAGDDPETVQNNQVLSDLADGIGIGPALSSVDSNLADAALRAMVTPPTPDHNPFAPPPMPEQNMWAVPDHNPFTPPMPEQRPADLPPMPERRPADVPMPERRADALGPEDDMQDLASADMLSGDLPGDLAGDPSFDSPDTESTSDPTSGLSVDGYSVPGVDVGSAPDGVPGTESDLGSYSVPGVDVGSVPDGVPGTTSDLGGYSVPGVDVGSAPDGVPGTASDVGDTSSYGSDTTSYGSDTSSYGGDTTSYGGDTTSYGGDTSSYGGDSSTSSDSSSTSYGGGDSSGSDGGDSSSSSSDGGGGDSSTSSYGGGSSSDGGSSTSSGDGGSSSSGDGGGSTSSGGDSGGGW